MSKIDFEAKIRLDFIYMDQIRREGKSYERTADMVNNVVSFMKA